MSFGIGCGLDSNFADLGEKLLSPDVQGIEAPGTMLAEGGHSNLRIISERDGTPFVIANRAGGGVALLNLATGQYCSLEEGLGFEPSAVDLRGAPRLVPYYAGSRDSAELRFADFECNTQPARVANGSGVFAVVDAPDGSRGSGVVLRSGRQLLLVDPLSDRRTVLGDNVAANPSRALDYYLWIDSGRLVLSDPELAPVAEVGEAVTSTAISIPLRQLAFTQAGPEGAVGGPLYVADALSPDAPELLEEDACNPRYVATQEGIRLSYLAPCGERRAVLYDPATERRQEIVDQLLGLPSVRRFRGETLISYRTSEDPRAPTGTLWLKRGTGEPERIGEGARGSGIIPLGPGRLRALVDWVEPVADFIQWENGQSTVLAERVFELGAVGELESGETTLIANFEGESGDLLRLDAEGNTARIARRVAPGSGREDGFLGDFENGRGTLYLLDRSDGSTRPFVQNVARNTYDATVQFSGWMVLGDDGGQPGSTLSLHLLDPDRSFVVSEGVTEVREVDAPNRGLMYTVAEAAGGGIWFAKAL